jgi:hypothetical protein
MNRKIFVLTLAALATLGATAAKAQKAPLPTTYTVTETIGMLGDPFSVQIARKGNLGYMKHVKPGTSVVSSLTVIQIDKGIEYTWDPAAKPLDCSKSQFSGSWGDPFEDGLSMLDDLNKMNPKPAGTEQFLGQTVNILVADGPPTMGKVKVWVDAKTGAPLKITTTVPGAAPKVFSEFTALSLAAPDAALFKIPPTCTAPAVDTVALSVDAEIAKLTNDDPHNYVRAVYSADGPDSCNVTYKVVQAGTMKPIPPTLSVKVDIGGAMHPLVSPTHNGVYRIPNVPPNFNIETSFGDSSGDSFALIHRQCFGPETVLLYVIKNPAKATDGGDYYWVKSGKYAAPKK